MYGVHAAMQVLLLRLSMDHFEAAVISGVVLGFGGCLSTVSTWVVEVRLGSVMTGWHGKCDDCWLDCSITVSPATSVRDDRLLDGQLV
jgi:hypothetical protein